MRSSFLRKIENKYLWNYYKRKAEADEGKTKPEGDGEGRGKRGGGKEDRAGGLEAASDKVSDEVEILYL